MDINLAALGVFLGYYVFAATDYTDFSDRGARDKERKEINQLIYYPPDVIQHLPGVTVGHGQVKPVEVKVMPIAEYLYLLVKALNEVNPPQHFPLDGLDAQQLSQLQQLMDSYSVCAGCFLNDAHNLNNCTAKMIVCEAGSTCISASHQGSDQCPLLPFSACCSHSGSNRKCKTNQVGVHPNLPNSRSCQQIHYVITTCTGFLCNLGDQSKAQGLYSAVRRANTQPLDSWSEWSSWSQCPVTCGSGNHVRMRHCYDANSTVLKSDCPGSPMEIQSCPNLQQCPNSWSDWSAWSQCSATCGSGDHVRMRHCYDANSTVLKSDCTGSSMEKQSCQNLPPCQNIDSWSPWNEWTACTTTCGDGDQFRERHCQRSSGSTANDCPGLSIESRRCAIQDCSGILREWLSWTPCPSTCGAGIQFRERFCNYPGTTNISRNCHGETVEQKVCHLMDCPVDGMWGHWGEWGVCLAGRQVRSRKCDDPSPQHGGKECYTDDNTRDVETRTCDAITTPAPRVLEPPKIYGNASTMSGGNVSLLCLTTIAGVSVKWYYKENETLPPHAVQPEGTTHLIIMGANIQNTGSYTCVITDKELSSKAHQEVTMKESAAKIISLTAKPTHITDGATVQLQCDALGYPEPIVRWGYKDTFGNPYVPPPVKYIDEGKTILIASYQSILYGGTWTCNAVNKLGADHRDITI